MSREDKINLENFRREIEIRKLKEAEKNQIESWHVSSFFDWEYQEK